MANRHRRIPLPLLALFLLSLGGGCRSVGPAAEPADRPPEAIMKEKYPGIRYAAPEGEEQPELVILVHGLFRGSRHMRRIAGDLAAGGYAVYSYDYESTRDRIPRHGDGLRGFLLDLATRYPDRQFHLVTHSMGALLTRYALAHLDPAAPAAWQDPEAGRRLPASRFHRIVMIAPPNRGSEIARFAAHYIPGSERLVKPIGDLACGDDAFARSLPQIGAIPTGVIIARYDVAVKPELTDYPAAAATLTLDATHSFSVYSRRVRRATLHFLRTGTFPAADAAP